ncbi:MAG: ABC transporter ATP-binding protein, partial [Candidatus Cloacimonetes bacterium]|nr:ABC transporter ATP-binding protein [Candidatus Cloacimonadota bacterium]
GLAPVLILSYGGYEIIGGRLSLGSFIAFSSFTGYLLGPASRLANLNLHLQKALKALERIAEILAMPEEGKPSNRIILPDCFKLSFRQIDFSYEPGFRVLKNLDVELSSGERIGLMGGSGTGKTTLLHLICGLIYPDSGEILLNGNILGRNGLLGLRKQIAVVGHKAELFDDTIMNNIMAGNSKASCHEVERFCRLVNAHEFITQFPEGYDTRIGFQGEYLSAGQQQRIALARALISKPRILILDEVTANVDGKSQNYLLRTIYSLPRNMLILMVSHRYSTIRECDRVLILTDGKIRQIIESDRSTAYYSDSRNSAETEREGILRRH